MNDKITVYSSVEVAEMLGFAPSYIRVLLKRFPHLAPSKVGYTWVWTQSDIDRLKEWNAQRKRGAKK
jgi:NADH/NAD ratio-sensing transcriptional regulator Rex